jgi:hypothetical protein
MFTAQPILSTLAPVNLQELPVERNSKELGSVNPPASSTKSNWSFDGPLTDYDDSFEKLRKVRFAHRESDAVPESISRESLDADTLQAVSWISYSYCWQSPAFCHSPLYFEQPNFERYGQGPNYPWTSTASAASFVCDIVTLPVHIITAPPHSKSCTLGHGRPGDCEPIQRK